MLRVNLIKQPTSTVDWIDFQEGDVLFVNYIENNEAVQKPCKVIYADTESVIVEIDSDIPQPFVFSYMGFNPSVDEIKQAFNLTNSAFDRIDNAYSDLIQTDLTNIHFYMSQKTSLVQRVRVNLSIACTAQLPDDVNTLYAVGESEEGLDYFVRYERQDDSWVYKSGFNKFMTTSDIKFHVFDNVDIALTLYDNWDNPQQSIKELGGNFYGESQNVSYGMNLIQYICLQDLNPQGKIVNNSDECNVFNNGEEIQSVTHDGSAIK